MTEPTTEDTQELLQGWLKQADAADAIVTELASVPELVAQQPRLVSAMLSYMAAKAEANTIAKRFAERYRDDNA